MTFLQARSIFLAFSLILYCGGGDSHAVAAPSPALPVDAVMAKNAIEPHRAIYQIKMSSVKRGSQVLGITGIMSYVLKKSCHGWITDHRFDMVYQYSTSPSIRVDTKFSSFENFAGTDLTFSSSRSRDGEVYDKVRGNASIDPDHQKKSIADYSIPEGMQYDLSKGTLFPIAHTYYLISEARKGRRVIPSIVFDGSDDQGPVEINTVIGRKNDAQNLSDKQDSSNVKKSKIDNTLLNVPVWQVNMAIFPVDDAEVLADYELSMDLLENGIVREMNVDYHDFSINQKLVALEKVSPEKCEE